MQCYYLGGAEDSATRVLSKMSRPLSYSKPIDKVCEDLNKLDDQICKLRYEVEIDIKNVNLKSLRVRELRKILSSWNERCDGCIEKGESLTDDQGDSRLISLVKHPHEANRSSLFSSHRGVHPENRRAKTEIRETGTLIRAVRQARFILGS